jgi:dihydroflavonol-4-reductase
MQLTDTILVTGGTGFLGARIIAQLAAAGYHVRASVRSPEREGEIREALSRAGVGDDFKLDIVRAELSADDGWAEAVAGIDYVLHTASPFPPVVPLDDDEVIAPARDGALRVLRAADDAGVKRVVMTSSFAAVGYGHEPTERAFTEQDWTNLDAPLAAYIRSKAVAERAAWDHLSRAAGPLELAVINPVGIFGPPLVTDLASSVMLARQLITTTSPLPRLATTVVDVRDVADLHIRAMLAPAAAGQRFLASAGEPVTFQELAHILRKAVGADAEAPVLDDEIVRRLAKTDPGMANNATELGKFRRVSSEKARRVLGWRPRSTRETLEATALALRDLGLLTA